MTSAEQPQESREKVTGDKSPAALELIKFAAFLEGVPPSQERAISDLVKREGPRNARTINRPALTLHCPSPSCKGDRIFRCTDVGQTLQEENAFRDFYFTYLCSNCRMSMKMFSLRVSVDASSEDAGAAYKYGEKPPYGPPTPPRLLTLLEDQRDTFLKGRRCEFQNLGVGAFGYYRRVVEHQKNRIIDEIISVSKTIGASEENLAALDAARNETQFSKSVSLVKDALPQTLLINGQNPLTLLHSALSAGLHEQPDEKCLELAHAIRVVLAELAEKLSQALKDKAELTAALSLLMKRD
ncbi:hypothetical protein AB7813_03710 [Tardiphaga sp. 20_F10_N6_6]|uniref:hypothetical protein n=1 Tax=Tardiphaga sp. 20_F10_N6_6 TaxID=3240788 RepID=UPI003F8C88ED